MAAIKTKALIIREQDYAEQDKLLTLFTATEGKQKAIAHGVRRTKSSLTAATQLFAYSDIVYFPGKSFARITQANLIEAYYPLRQDLKKMAIGSCILELLDAFFDFEQGNASLLKVAIHSLYYISENRCKQDESLPAAFGLKCARSQGIMPVLTECAHCHRTEDLDYFGIEDGGAMCRQCSNDHGMTYRLLPDQLSVMEYLMNAPIKAIKDRTFDPALLNRINTLTARYIAANLGKRLKAFEFYQEMLF